MCLLGWCEQLLLSRDLFIDPVPLLFLNTSKGQSVVKCLNLGCGNRYHPAWQNVDFSPADSTILAHDLRNALPFPNMTFDLVYHSHVLEHFSPADAKRFVGECFRVLRPSGTMRVAVPDLESLAARYLRKLECADGGDASAVIEHQWAIIQLIDQCTRESSGGEMVKFLESVTIQDLEVLSTTSSTAREVLRHRTRDGLDRQSPRPRTIFEKLHRIASALLRNLRTADTKQGSAARDFRMSGELHKWMYDRVSIRQLLGDVGFTASHVVGPLESAIDGWEDFRLDANADGSIYKPDSLIIECTKPLVLQPFTAETLP